MPPLGKRVRAALTNTYAANRQMYENPPLSKKQRTQVKTIAKSTQELKRVPNTGSVSMVDSSHYVINPLYNIPQSVTAGGRISNSINLKYIDLNFTLFLAQTTSIPVDVWVYAFWSDLEAITSSTNPTQVTTANVLTTLPFIGAISSNQSSLLQFDPFQCTPVWSKHFTINPQGYPSASNADAQRVVVSKRFYMKNRKVKYLHDSASYNEGKNLYIGWVSSGNGTVDTTTTCALYQSHMVTFQE